MNNETQLIDLGIALEKIQQLKQQLESCQNELSGISGQLKEAFEVMNTIERMEEDEEYPATRISKAAKMCRQFLAKYRGGGNERLDNCI